MTAQVPKTAAATYIENCTSKSIIRNVIAACKKEAEHNILYIPLQEHEWRVSYYTGLQKKIISNLQKEPIYRIPEKIDIKTHIQLLKCLKQSYELQNVHCLKQLYLLLKMENTATFSEFTTDLNILGYDYRKSKNGIGFLMENRKISFERSLYLNKLRKIRKSNTEIYYIDTRVIDKNLTFKKTWFPEVNALSFASNINVFFHIISQNSFIHGLLCSEASEKSLKKWLVDIVFKIIKPSSVIVMDKDPLCGSRQDNSISRYHSKQDMMKWLEKHNVPCSPNLNKAELYELIQWCPRISREKNDIDYIIECHGHTVLRLPTNFHDLSPTDQLWKHVKTKFSEKIGNFNSLTDLKCELLAYLPSIPSEQFIEYENVIIQLENELLELDTEIENALDLFTWDSYGENFVSKLIDDEND